MKSKKWLGLFVVIGFVLALVSGSWAAEADKVNINTASEQELTQLNDVGPVKAAAIVKYRQDNGLFKSPEDIMKVDGIGQKIYDSNKDRIIVGNPAEVKTENPSEAPKKK